jgi:archaellum component FlaF (FlaF/FlaG flagellin family)
MFWKKWMPIVMVALMVFSLFSPNALAEVNANVVDSQLLDLQTGEKVAGVNPAAIEDLSATAAIKGRVLKGTTPLANLVFSAHRVDSLQSWVDFMTDENGYFSSHLPDGVFQVDGIWVDEESKWYPVNQQFTVKNSELVGSSELLIQIFEEKHNVTGTIKKGDEVLGDLVFSLRSTTREELWYDAKTDENGQFSLALPNGTYMIEGIWDAEIWGWYPIKKEFTVTDSVQLDIDVLKDTPHEAKPNVTGKLTNKGKVLSHLVFSIRTTTGDVKWYDARTDKNGNFQFVLPNGTYKLEGIWVESELTWYILNKDLVVDGSLSVSFDVLEENRAIQNVNGQLKNGDKAVANTVFSIHSINGEEVWFDTKTDEEGQFGFILPDGEYQLDGIWQVAEEKWYVLNEQFAVVNGALVGVNTLEINLIPAVPTNGNVYGIVTDGGKAIENAKVEIRKDDGSGTNYQQLTDANGKYELNLPNGDYYVYSVSNEVIGNVMMNLSITIEAGKLIVNGTEKESLDLELPGQTLTIQFTGPEGPIPNGYISFNGPTTHLYYSVKTDTNGQFIGRLADGNYTIYSVNANNGSYFYYHIPFVVRDGVLYMNDQVKSQIEISLPALNFSALLELNGKAMSNAVLLLEKDVNGRIFNIQPRTNETGKVVARLTDGLYQIKQVYDFNQYQSYKINQSFEMVNGKIVENGVIVDQLTINASKQELQFVEQDGTPVKHAQIRISNVNGGYTTYLNTNENGILDHFLFDGDYKIVQADGEFLTIPFSVKNQQLVVDQVPKNKHVVTLSPITVSGKAMETTGAALTGTVFGVTQDATYHNWNVEIKENGVFHLRLPDGKYSFRGISVENWTDLNKPFEVENGLLKVNGVIQPEFILSLPPVTLHGKAYDENGQQLKGSSYISIREDREFFGTFYSKSVKDGEFSFRLPDGNYKVASLQIELGSSIALDIKFSIVNGQLTVNGQSKDFLEVNLKQPNLFGSLVDENNLPLANARLNLSKDNDPLNSVTILTDQAGNFSTPLSDGHYAFTDVTIQEKGYQIDVLFEIRENKLFVNGVAQAQLAIKLPPVSLKGKVVNTDGAVITNAGITIQRVEGDIKHYYKNLDATGQFDMRLPDGNYQVNNITLHEDRTYYPLNIRFTISGGKLVMNGVQQDFLTVTLSQQYTFEMFVKDDGKPVVDATVFWGVKGANGSRGYDTDANGKITIQAENGEYHIRMAFLSNYDYVPMYIDFSIIDGKLFMNGEEQEQLHLSIPKGRVVGEVTNSQGPVAGAPILISKVEDYKETSLGNTNTLTNGQYGFRLEDGEYNVKVIYESRVVQTKRIRIEDGLLYVDNVQTDKLDFRLNP